MSNKHCLQASWIFLCVFSLLLLHGLPGRAATLLGATAEVHRVLFVGNSFSFDVPKAFAELCRKTGHDVKVDQATFGGWTLAKHDQQGSANKFTNGWDIIVIQEYSRLPSLPEANMRTNSLPFAKKLVAAARRAGAHPLLFQTWGYRKGDTEIAKNDTYQAMQRRLISGYRLLARETDTDVAPVGKAWQIVRTRNPDVDLYSTDIKHPGKAGVQLAACVFFATIFGGDPEKLPASGDLPPETLAALHRAAGRAAPWRMLDPTAPVPAR